MSALFYNFDLQEFNRTHPYCYAVCASDAKKKKSGGDRSVVEGLDRRAVADRHGEGIPAESGAPAGACRSDDVELFSVHTFQLRSSEDLREAVRGADLKIVQLAPGAFTGQLTHAALRGVSFSAGDFYPDIRARGVMNPHLVTVGTMVESDGEVLQWDYNIAPGDVVVFPQAVEQEGRFTGRSRYATITLAAEELALHTAGEASLQDPAFWATINRFHRPRNLRMRTCEALGSKIEELRSGRLPRTAGGIDFLRRVLIESFLKGAIEEVYQRYDERYHRNAKLVRNVEDYVDALGADRPVHVSELCFVFQVSRRTLHRAFFEALGMGPIAYLQKRRLAAVHGILLSQELGSGGITQVALEYGFADLGRFAGYYRQLFGETPSQTRSRRLC